MLYYFNPYQSSVAFLVICDQMTGFYMQSNDWFLYKSNTGLKWVNPHILGVPDFLVFQNTFRLALSED